MANQAGERVVNGIKTRVLHGKDYVEVAERVRIVHELKKPFEVLESAPFEIGGRLVWRVVARVDDKQYIGNAEVKLDAPKNSPDGTNPFECAETSAIGRALAFAGLGTIESISSYDEIVRSQPFVAMVEQASSRVVEAGGQRQIVQSQKPTWALLFEDGKAGGIWTSPAEFYAKVGFWFGSENVNRAFLDDLDAMQLDTLKTLMHKEMQQAA